MTLIRRKIGQKDYHKVLDIWEKSVISTHDFLKEKDYYREIITQFSRST